MSGNAKSMGEGEECSIVHVEREQDSVGVKLG